MYIGGCESRVWGSHEAIRLDRTLGWNMNLLRGMGFVVFFVGTGVVLGQAQQVRPQIVTRSELEGGVAVVQVAPRFVTTIRLPEAVNSIVVGDPSEFQVEHSAREPELVFVKPLTTQPEETNLLISTADGEDVSLLLVSRGKDGKAAPIKVDLLVKYQSARGFLVQPSAFPFALVGETVPLTQPNVANGSSSETQGNVVSPKTLGDPPTKSARGKDLDQLLKQQEQAPLPVLYGTHLRLENKGGDPIRAGVSEVTDVGQDVTVLFSVVNPTKHAILLMPPQVQLAGRTKSGKLIHHSHWTSSEQLPVVEFRLSRWRLAPGERADGVALFERPPYKMSNETLLLQMAEAGAVNRPALAPIGFGVSTLREGPNGRGK